MRYSAVVGIALVLMGCGSSQQGEQAQSLIAAVTASPTPSPSPAGAFAPAPSPSSEPLLCQAPQITEDGWIAETVTCMGGNLGTQTEQLNIASEFQLIAVDSGCSTGVQGSYGDCEWRFEIQNNTNSGICIVATVTKQPGYTTSYQAQACGTSFNETTNELTN